MWSHTTLLVARHEGLLARRESLVAKGARLERELKADFARGDLDTECDLDRSSRLVRLVGTGPFCSHGFENSD